jgi:thiol:disulfide interchange protein DsbG
MKKILSTTAIITTFAMFLSGCDSVEKSEELVNKSTNNQLTILNHFDAEPDLYGFVVRNKNSQEGIVYTTRDGEYFFTGQLFNAIGKNLTQEQFNTYVEPESAKYAYAHANKTSYIQQGKDSAAHKIYAVVDPNCLYCHKFIEATQSYINKGDLAVRWIVVGFLKPTSQTKAYSIIGADDQVKALLENEKAFNESTEEGGIKPTENASGSTKREFEKNMAFMKDAHIMGSPAVIYQTQGGIKQLTQGMPKDLKQFMNIPGNAW